MMGIAAGLARCGYIPFVYSMSNFVTMRCLEQIRNDISYPALPVRILSVGGGYTYGPLGYSHHGIEDIAVMRAMPYMRIEVPTSNSELFEVAQLCQDYQAPIYIRLPRESYETEEESTGIKMGDYCEYDDFHAVILTYGDGYPLALELAALLRSEGLLVSVETARTVRPFARSRLFAYKTPLIIIEEHSDFGGLAGEYLELVSSAGGRCLTFGLTPQHVAGTREELTKSSMDLNTMFSEALEWVTTYDNER
jgi:transketolase